MESERKDEYLYGMNMFFDVCINIISMLVIGAVAGRLWECIVFCAAYKFIRKYTGGFHFESQLHCYISSCIMYIIAIYAVNYIPFDIYAASAVTAVSLIVLWILSPVEAVHKPLDECEKDVFKKRARINIAIMFVVYSVCLFVNHEAAYVIAIGITFAALLAVPGKLRQHRTING